jgi:hypothetical protein
MGSDPCAGSAVSTNNASNALRTPHLKDGSSFSTRFVMTAQFWMLWTIGLD